MDGSIDCFNLTYWADVLWVRLRFNLENGALNNLESIRGGSLGCVYEVLECSKMYIFK